MAAANPNAWEVKTYEAILPAPLNGPTGPLQAPHPPLTLPNEPQWETMQAFSAPAMHLEIQDHGQQEPLSPQVSEQPTAPQMARWSPMKAPGARKLTPWTSLDIVTPDSDPAYFVPKPKRRFTPWLIVLGAIVATGVVAALWLDKNNAARSSAWLRSSSPSLATTRTPVTQPAQATPVQVPPPPPESLLTAEATVQKVGILLRDLLGTNASSVRLASIANPSGNRESIAAFFRQFPSAIEVSGIRALPATVQPLPGLHPITLCAVDASMPTGKVSGLARLVSDSNGEPKLDWPTLHDSLLKKLRYYSEKPRDEPEWIVIGIRRNFGFDEPAETREKHHVFDIQGLGDGSDHILAFAPKDLPVGRALDSTLRWKQLYLARALVHWSQVGDRQRISILDADLVPAVTSSP